MAVCMSALQQRQTCACSCDGLAPFFVLHISCSKDSSYAGLGGSRLCDNVAILIHLKLALQKLGGWRMPNCKEEPCHLRRSGTPFNAQALPQDPSTPKLPENRVQEQEVQG
jgi:hypothetical protein